MEKLGNHNPTKDGSLKGVFSSLISEKGLERKMLSMRGVGAAPTFRSNDSEGGYFISQLLQSGKGSEKSLP